MHKHDGLEPREREREEGRARFVDTRKTRRRRMSRQRRVSVLPRNVDAAASVAAAEAAAATL